MATITRSTFLNTRLLAVLFLGFASGLPLALTGPTLQAWYTEAHVDLLTIGMLSLVGIPYTVKFMWAPVMDHFTLPWIGKRRGWILIMQAGLVLTLLLLAQLNPATHAKAMSVMALIVAFLSASQDISVDAYRTDVLLPEERGLGASFFIFSYRIAALVSGALGLIIADYIGWKLTYEIMAVLMLFAMIPTFNAPRVVEPIRQASQNFWQTIMIAASDLFQRDKIILLLLFVIFYKFGDALALQLMTNFLLHTLGFTLKQVGVAYKLCGFVATLLGAFVGGVMLTRWNIFRGLLVFGLAQTFSNLMFVLLAVASKSFALMAISIFLENFCGGLSTAAMFAFLMSICNQRYSATQFALLSAIAVIGRVFMGPVASLMVMHLGWVMFYVWSFVLCFPGILFLILLKDEVLTYAQVTTD